jgi:SEC-C motif domain protein
VDRAPRGAITSVIKHIAKPSKPRKKDMEQRNQCRGRIRPLRSPGAVGPILLVVFAMLYGSTPVYGFANKKSGGKKNPLENKSGTPKGFGAPPPSLEDILAKFSTRVPPNPENVDCPCGSSNTYAECCGPLHNQVRGCTSMIDVLRSRYSAFCWRNIGYILATTHPTNRDYSDDKVAWAKDLNRDGMFDSFDFVKLEVVKEEAGSDENEGFIEFQVTMRGRGEDEGLRRGGRRSAAAVAGLETVIKERSRFLRDTENGIWSYANGDVSSEVAGLEDIKLND